MIHNGMGGGYLSNTMAAISDLFELEQMCVIVDNGDIDEVALAFALLARNLPDDVDVPLGVCVRKEKQLVDYQSLFNVAPFSDRHFEPLSWPLSVPGLIALGERSSKVPTISKTRIGAASQMVQRYATLVSAKKRIHSEVAEGQLWKGASAGRIRLAGNHFGRFISPFKVVLIDDDHEFRCLTREKLPRPEPTDADGIRLFCHPTLEDYKRAWERGESPRPEDVEVFFLDIVNRDHETQGTTANSEPASIKGIERALPSLRRHKGLQLFPQIYMLSHLPSERVAHICYQAGADYYIEKAYFVSEPHIATMLAELLWHTIVRKTEALRPSAQDLSSKVLGVAAGDLKAERNVLTSEKGIGWEELDHVDDETFIARYRLIWDLFSNVMGRKIDRIDLVERFGKGLSGALTVAVVAWLTGEDRVGRAERPGRGPRRSTPMAPRIIKVDLADKMLDELQAYDKFVAPIASDSYARIEPALMRSGPLAAISYTLAGSQEEASSARIMDCRDLLLMGHPLAREVPEAIFGRLLTPLHASEQERKITKGVDHLEEYFARDLAPVLCGDTSPGSEEKRFMEIERVRFDKANPLVITALELRRIGKESSMKTPIFKMPTNIASTDGWYLRAGKTVELSEHLPKERFVDPVPTIEDRFRKDLATSGFVDDAAMLTEKRARFLEWVKAQEVVMTVEAALNKLREKAEIYWAVTHGDLNLQNAVCSDGSNRFWLIDFAKTKPGPPGVDFAVFEIEIRFQILAPIVARWLAKETDPDRWLASAVKLAKLFEARTQNAAYASVGTIVSAIGISHRDADVAQFRLAWQTLMDVRKVAFRGLYRSRTDRAVYDAILSLVCLRTVQRYEAELLSRDGPLGTLWSTVVLLTACERISELAIP